MWCVVCVFLFNMGDSFLCLYDIKKQLKRQNIPGRKKKQQQKTIEIEKKEWLKKHGLIKELTFNRGEIPHSRMS